MEMNDKEISCLPLSFHTASVRLPMSNIPVLRLTHMLVLPPELGEGVHTCTCSPSPAPPAPGMFTKKTHRASHCSLLKNLTKPPAPPGREKQVAMSERVHACTCTHCLSDRVPMTKAQTGREA